MDSKLKIVVLGAGGRLGAALAREYASQHDVTGFTHAQLDLAQPEVLRSTLEPLPFDVLINAAALTNVDYCEDHREEAMRLNAEAPRVLAEICREKDRRFIHVSTDYVFDGKKREPYTEEDSGRRDQRLRRVEAGRRVVGAWKRITARWSFAFPGSSDQIDRVLSMRS